MMIHAVSGAQGRILKVIGSGASSISPAPPICSTPKPPSASNSGNTGVFDESFPRLEKVSVTPFCRASRKFSVLNAFLRIIPCWSLYTTRTVQNLLTAPRLLPAVSEALAACQPVGRDPLLQVRPAPALSRSVHS